MSRIQLTDLKAKEMLYTVADFQSALKIRTKFRIIAFVKKQFTTNFLNDYVPAIVGTNTAHQSSQDGISCVDITFGFCQLFN